MLKGSNVVVFDCETVNPVDGFVITWNDHAKMGLSVACMYDFKTDDFSVHLEPDVPRMVERFKTADLVVAFNSKGFDNNLLRALGHDIDESNHWDMLEVSRRAAGWTDGALFPKGLRLDDHLSAMFGAQNMKTTAGENAPLWWQEGRMSEVISYCLADVKRERDLFIHMMTYGWVETATHGRKFIDRSFAAKRIWGSK